MEFPNLGEHCSEKSCNKLDFLPVKCDGCKKIYCNNHFSYSKHNCPSPGTSDFQVPICPLCGEPVPTPPGVQPDQTVGQHIDKYCKLETKKIFTNKCTFGGCKKKELVPITCSVCKKNFCLTHRHSTDHKCSGPPNHATTRRLPDRSRDRNIAQSVQGDMNDDEALAQALQLSMIEQDKLVSNNNHSTNIVSENKNKCQLS